MEDTVYTALEDEYNRTHYHSGAGLRNRKAQRSKETEISLLLEEDEYIGLSSLEITAVPDEDEMYPPPDPGQHQVGFEVSYLDIVNGVSNVTWSCVGFVCVSLTSCALKLKSISCCGSGEREESWNRGLSVQLVNEAKETYEDYSLGYYILLLFFSKMPVLHRFWNFEEKLVNALPETKLVQDGFIREVFRNHVISDVAVNTTHPHGNSASGRTKGDNFINSFAFAIQKDPYSISSSTKDVELGIHGVRKIHTTKDTGLPVPKSSFGPNTIIKTIDVDYHLTNEQILGYYPIIMYTLQPQVLARRNSDQHFYFCEDGENVRTLISATSGYVHKVWKYDKDTYSAFRFSWTLFCDAPWTYGLSYTSYSKEMRDMSPDRYVVLLSPRARLYGKAALALYLQLGETPLERYQVNVGKVQILPSMKGSSVIHSVKKPEDTFSIELEDVTWRGLKIKTTEKTEIGNISRELRAAKYAWDDGPKDVAIPSLARELILLHPGHAPEPVSCPETIFYTPAYLDLPHEVQTEAGRLIGEGMVRNGVFAPTRGLSSDISTIQGRVEKPRKENVNIPSTYYKFAQEFVVHIIPDSKANQLDPYTVDQVREKQSRPTQKALYERVAGFLYPSMSLSFQAFQKNEPYANLNDPRNISNPDAVFKTVYAQFIYAMSDIMKDQHWYAFGLNPRQLAERVFEKCQGAKEIGVTDFSRLDGSLVAFLKALELATMYRAFRTTWHEEITKLHGSMAKSKGFTKSGVAYDAGTSRLSGEMGTSTFNSEITAFVAYCAFRAAGFEPERAFRAIGIYGGDDGLTPNMPKEFYEKVCIDLGLDAKVQMVREEPLVFLGRIYYNPRDSAGSSIDLARCLKKLHYTASPSNIQTEVVLVRKALSLAYTDPKTPIVGPWAQAILLKYQALSHEVSVSDDMSWWYRAFHDEGEENAFPSADYGDMVDFLSLQLDISSDKVREVDEHFRSLKTRLLLEHVTKVNGGVCGEETQIDWWPLLREYAAEEIEIKTTAQFRGEIVGELKKAPVEVQAHGVRYMHSKETGNRSDIKKDARIINGTPCPTKSCKNLVMNPKCLTCAQCTKNNKRNRQTRKNEKRRRGKAGDTNPKVKN